MKKFALVFVLALVGAGVYAASAFALHFDNSDCVESGPGGIWICTTGQVGAGYSGPAVAGGKVYLTDRQLAAGVKNPSSPWGRGEIPGQERIVCCHR